MMGLIDSYRLLRVQICLFSSNQVRIKPDLTDENQKIDERYLPGPGSIDRYIRTIELLEIDIFRTTDLGLVDQNIVRKFSFC